MELSPANYTNAPCTAVRYFTTLLSYLILSVQQDDDSLYQQIGLKFEEETSKMLHLEHGFAWC